jgi:sugar phosphate isomerase/epimerase
MRLGVVETVLRVGLEQDTAWAAAAGFAGIGLEMARVVDAGLDRACALMRDSGLLASSLLSDLEAGSAPLDAIEHAVDVAAALGAPFILVGAGPLGGDSLAAADHTRQQWFETMGPVATSRGVVIALEPFHPILRATTYVHTLRHAAELTGGRPGTGLVVDLAHLWWDRYFLTDVADHLQDIVTVQVSGVPTDALTELRYDRCPPWEGDIPVLELLNTIAAEGYDGWLEDEMIIRIAKEDRPTYLAASRRFLDTIHSASGEADVC